MSIYHQPTCTSNHSQHPLSSVLFPLLYPHFIIICSTFLPNNLLYERWASLLLLISQNCNYSLTTMQQLHIHASSIQHPASCLYEQTNHEIKGEEGKRQRVKNPCQPLPPITHHIHSIPAKNHLIHSPLLRSLASHLMQSRCAKVCMMRWVGSTL